MPNYSAKIIWQRNPGELFADRKYSRLHSWEFDGGVVVPPSPSPSPHVVPAPFSSEANVDPEEAFVASLSSCHMLFFLDFASREKFVINSYSDNAIGVMEKNAEGKTAMTKVTLRPVILLSEKTPMSDAALQGLHHKAHEHCFIANSVKTLIVIEPSMTIGEI